MLIKRQSCGFVSVFLRSLKMSKTTEQVTLVLKFKIERPPKEILSLPHPKINIIPYCSKALLLALLPGGQ